MYSLLVVDDEPYIADSIYDDLRYYDELDLEVFKAYSADEAMEMMQKFKMDIVLSDICMPGMDGLELLNWIRLQWPYCKVIFLSGYNDFEYVQSALRNKAADFILKAEGRKPVYTAIQKAICEIEDERKNVQYIENARMQMNHALPLLKNKYLLDIVYGLECLSDEMRKHFDELDIPLNPDIPVLLFIGRVDHWPGNPVLTKKMESIYGIQDIVEKHLGASVSLMPLMCSYDKLLWLAQPKELISMDHPMELELPLLQRISHYVFSMIDSVQRMIHETLHVPVSFAVGKAPVFWESVAAKYSHLENLLNKMSGISSEIILTDEVHPRVSPGEKEEKKYRQIISEKFKKISLLETYLESGQAEEFLQLLEEILGCIDQEKQIPYLLEGKAYYSIAMVFLNYFEKLDYSNFLTQEEDFQLEKLLKLESHPSWKEASSYFVSLAKSIFKQKSNEFIESTDKIIQNINTYIHEHLNDDVSLNKLSDISNYNPFYLSRLYKQVTGKSITDYISELKFEKARELLKQVEIRINEIAASLGFTHASYFTRFFKKYANMTPQEYRDSLP